MASKLNRGGWMEGEVGKGVRVDLAALALGLAVHGCAVTGQTCQSRVGKATVACPVLSV